MNSLLDPNLAYLLFTGGVTLAFLALFVPGTGILELSALFILFGAIYLMAQLPLNFWALALMAIALVPLGLSLRFRRQTLALLIGSMVVMLAGSLFLFRSGPNGAGVNPFVAVLVSVGLGVMIWFMGRKSLDAHSLRLSINPDRVVGLTGVARTDLVQPRGGSGPAEGSVYAGGENWTARSREPLPAGTPVRVVRRSGLTVDVEKDETR